MNYNNPFSGWAEAGQGPSSTAWGDELSPPPSVFGALPYPSGPSLLNLLTFYFTSFKPDIMNCTIVGPQAQNYYHIVTDNHMPGYTVIRNGEGKNISLIEWQSHPLLEIRGTLAKQNIISWLKLSSDRSSRSMDIRGQRYTWAPHERSINLFGGSPSAPVLMARILRGKGCITLEVAQDTVKLGLLDSVVTAAFLLQCGRNID